GGGHGQKVLTFFAHGIYLVDPVCQVGGGGVGAQDHMTVKGFFQHLGGADDVLLAEDGFGVALGLVQNTCFILHGVVDLHGHGAAGRVFGHAPVGHKELGNLLLYGKLPDVSGGAPGGGQAPVVHGAEGAAAVNVLE